MSDETYNGWSGMGTRASAYATWRIALEIFDDYPDYDAWDEKPDVDTLADSLRDYVDQYVDELVPAEGATAYVRGWIDAFLDDVSWEEIAEGQLSDWPSDDDDSDDEDDSDAS